MNAIIFTYTMKHFFFWFLQNLAQNLVPIKSYFSQQNHFGTECEYDSAGELNIAVP